MRYVRRFWRDNWGSVLTVAIFAGTFILEAYTPLGFVDWFFYFLPLLLGFPIPLPRMYFFSSVASALIVLGIAVSPPGVVPFAFVLYERSGAVAMLWLATALAKKRKSSEDTYREVAETANSIILRWDMDGKIIYLNSYGLAFFGYPARALIGRPMDILFPSTGSGGRDLRGFARHISRTPEAYVRYESEIVRSGGSRAWVYWTNRMLYDARGKPREVLSIGSDMTERRKAEEALRHAEEHLSLALEAGNEGTFEYDLIGNTIFWDSGSRKIFGLPDRASAGFNDFLALVHFEDRRRVEAAIKAMILPPFSGHAAMEFRIVRPGDEVRWVSLRGKVYFEQHAGQVRAVRFIGTNADITERKRAEEDLQASELRYYTLFESMGEGFAACEVIYDASGKAVDYRYLRVNHAFAALIGLPHEQIEGHTARTLIPGLEESWIATYDRIVRSGRSERFENRIQILERHYVAYAWRSGPGQFAVVFNDVTELKQKEDALRKSREQLRYAFEQYRLALATANQGTVSYYPPGGKIVLDERSRALFGLRERAVPIDELYVSLEPADSARFREKMEQALRPPAGKELDVELRITGPGGKPRWVSMKGKTYAVSGAPPQNGVRYVGIVADISKHKEAEDILRRDRDLLDNLVTERSYRLLETQKELDRSRRLSDIGTLAATVAHELRNPLAFIKLAGTNIKRKVSDPDIGEKLDSIVERIDDGNKIIDDLLFYARLRPPRFEQVPVRELVEDIITTSSARYAGRQIALQFDPDSIVDDTVAADRLQLREIVVNLLNNAVEAVPAARRGEIRIGISRADGQIDIRIRDNGTGIKPEELDRVFEPFFTTKRGGTGLGLSVVKQIVDMHNGSIRLESEWGKGTTAILRLPRTQNKP